MNLSFRNLVVLAAAFGFMAFSAATPLQARESNEGMDDSSAIYDAGSIYPESVFETTREGIDNSERHNKSADKLTTTLKMRRPSTPAPNQAPDEPRFMMPEINSAADLNTSWGYGSGENRYNATIFKASTNVWPHSEVPLHPLLFKSLVATESAFNPTAQSWSGAAGLVQLTPDTARRFGLNWTTSRDPQYAVPAGVRALAEKAQAIIHPENYHKILGVQPAQCLYASNVAEAYRRLGAPSTEQYWHLMLAAYNGGGGTVLRAMSIAWTRGQDPRSWEVLIGAGNPQNSPLYLACREIYRGGAMGKYREMSAYPIKIIKLYNKSVPSHYSVRST